MTYYDRTSSAHSDGTRVFKSKEDQANERMVAAELEGAWKCHIRSFGALSAIDWYAEVDGRLMALVELKTRTHSSKKFATVFLNVRKWLALSLGAIGLGCDAIFVVKFEDGIFWIKNDDIDGSLHKIAGCSRIVKSVNDIEPVIEVPVAKMVQL